MTFANSSIPPDARTSPSNSAPTAEAERQRRAHNDNPQVAPQDYVPPAPLNADEREAIRRKGMADVARIFGFGQDGNVGQRAAPAAPATPQAPRRNSPSRPGWFAKMMQQADKLGQMIWAPVNVEKSTRNEAKAAEKSIAQQWIDKRVRNAQRRIRPLPQEANDGQAWRAANNLPGCLKKPGAAKPAGGRGIRFAELPPALSAPPPLPTVLWNGLMTAAAKMHFSFLPQTQVAWNDSGVACVAHSAINVEINGRMQQAHANHMQVRHAPAAQGAPALHHAYIAGQSPQPWAACEKMLVIGIETGQGLFQFNSPAAQARLRGEASVDGGHGESLVPVIEQLIARKKEADRTGRPCLLAGRFVVDRIVCEANNDDHSRYLIRVTSPADGKTITIPITQAGLKFDNNVLHAKEITRSKKLLDDHKKSIARHGGTVRDTPPIISHVGVGRNATLIVFNEIASMMQRGMIRSAADLDRALTHVITEGRRARGPGFIHSIEQLAQLRELLAKMLRQQEARIAAAEESKNQADLDGPMTSDDEVD